MDIRENAGSCKGRWCTASGMPRSQIQQRRADHRFFAKTPLNLHIALAYRSLRENLDPSTLGHKLGQSGAGECAKLRRVVYTSTIVVEFPQRGGQIRTALNTLLRHEEEKITVTVSMGISEFVDDDTAETVFARADKALYDAKEGGRNQCCLGLEGAPQKDQ